MTLLDNSAAVNYPGDASPSTLDNFCNIVANLNTTGTTNMDSNQIVGWWITSGTPISSQVNDQSSLNTALGNALINPTSVTPADTSFIYKSTSGNALSQAFACGANLDPAKQYFATPFVSLDDSPVPADFSNNTTSGNITINDWNGSSPGVTNIPINVYQLPQHRESETGVY